MVAMGKANFKNEVQQVKIDIVKRGDPRKSFDKAMCDLAAKDPRVFLVTADMGGVNPDFIKNYRSRFIDVGIAEQNMIGVAAGMALCGKIPFATTMACFISMRACEQVRTDVSYPCLNVKFFGFGCGTSYGNLASTHHSTEDLAIMRAIPHMTVLSPAGPVEAYKALMAAAEYPGPVFIRAARGDEPMIYDGDYDFTIGKAIALRDGKDVAIIATGIAVSRALQAAQELAKKGIEARVVNVHTLKPLDREMIIKAATGVKGVITAEDHNIYGGLGGAVAEVLAEEHMGPLRRVGIEDLFCAIGSHEEILEKHDVSAAKIKKVAQELCKGKVKPTVKQTALKAKTKKVVPQGRSRSKVSLGGKSKIRRKK
jgi:transketolase